MTYAVKLLKKEKLTHDVIGLTLERPAGYSFSPGQFLEFTLQEPSRPSKQLRLSLTGLNSDPDLHVAVKTHKSLEVNATHLNWLEPGEEVRISEPKDEVVYRGPGVFIAGGTGISPFMAIFRQLEKDGKLDGNMLVFANKRGEDICFEGELHRMFGTDIISVLAFEDRPRNIAGQIDVGFIKEHVKDLDQPFYVCGPEPFVNDVVDVLTEVGVPKSRMHLYY
jgi:ferredoxin-NADP reductase